MCLDAGAVLKRHVLCLHCGEDYLFTLRGIANNPELRCHGCGGSIRLCDRVYEPLLSDVRNALSEIDSVQSSFISVRPSFAI
jgi:DNA-directed RNA polymerase subunit RPC12/RpoP